MLIAKLAKQQTSNSYLQQVISEYKKDLRAVKKLQLERNQYLARLELISNLQSHRTETIDIFNALAVNLPDCLYLHTVKREDGKVTISGKAQTDTCIARLMRNFNNTTRFTEPHLKEIKTDNSNLTYNKDFQLQFNQK
jgi:type IV pilus assembly protein PilN